MTDLTQAADALVQKTTEVATQNAQLATAINQNAFILSAFGWQVNLITVMITLLIAGVLVLFWKIQRSEKLDFTDMFTADGRKVSLTKVLQFLAGIASTWVVVKMGMQGTLSSEVFAIYLTYAASIEGFSKFVSAKYGYTETSVKDTAVAKE